MDRTMVQGSSLRRMAVNFPRGTLSRTGGKLGATGVSGNGGPAVASDEVTQVTQHLVEYFYFEILCAGSLK